MQQAHLEEIKQAVADQVKISVNGKIDRLADDFKEHKADMQPILDMYRAANTGGKFIVWIATLLTSLAAIYLFFTKLK